jgi:hypothetical protein
MMLLSNPGISVSSQAKQSEYSFSKAIIGSCRDGSNFLLTNVGRGLSPGPMSTSSSTSADVNPYPSFPLSAKSLQIDEERDRKSFGRSFRSAALSYSLTLETLQTDAWPPARAGPPCDCYHYLIHLSLNSYILFFGADCRGRPCEVHRSVLSSALRLLCEAGG